MSVRSTARPGSSAADIDRQHGKITKIELFFEARTEHFRKFTTDAHNTTIYEGVEIVESLCPATGKLLAGQKFSRVDLWIWQHKAIFRLKGGWVAVATFLDDTGFTYISR